jgi:hypothetical protein
MGNESHFSFKRSASDFAAMQESPDTLFGLTDGNLLDLWEITIAFGDYSRCRFSGKERNGIVSLFSMKPLFSFVFKSGPVAQLWVCKSPSKKQESIEEIRKADLERDFHLIRTKGNISVLVQKELNIREIRDFISWFGTVEVFEGTVCRDGQKIRPIPAFLSFLPKRRRRRNSGVVVDFLDNEKVRSNGKTGFSSAVVVGFPSASEAAKRPLCLECPG